MDDSYVNGIIYLAKLKMGLPLFDSQPYTFSVHVTVGNQQCILTHEELKSRKLDLLQNANKKVDFSDAKELQNPNLEQPLNLSKTGDHLGSEEAQKCDQTSLDQMKIEKCEYEDATSSSFSNGSVVPDHTSDEQGTSEQYCESTKINDSSYPAEQVSAEPDSSKELGEIMEGTPGTSPVSTSAEENEITVDNSTKVEVRKEENTSKVDLGSNQKHDSNHSALNRYFSKMRRCYFCNEMVLHYSWNCPKRREERERNRLSPWSPWKPPYTNYTRFGPEYKPYQRLFPKYDHLRNAGMSYGQKYNAPAKVGTFRRVYEMSQNLNHGARNRPQPTKKSKKASSSGSTSDHKILFQGEWYTNRVAADAESYLNKKEEVGNRIKKELRELDEGFEDIQHVFSEDELPNENPIFAYDKIEKNFKDENNDPGGSSSFSTAA